MNQRLVFEGLKRFIAILIASLILFSPGTVYAGKEMDTRMIADVNKPGVVMLQTIYSGTVVIPEFTVTEMTMNHIYDKVLDRVLSGEVAYDERAIYSEILMMLFEKPVEYFTPTGTSLTVDAQVGAMGTGFVVTPDGYIVTNAHVVATPEEDLKNTFLQFGLSEMLNQSVHDLLALNESGYITVTEEMLMNIQYSIAQFYLNHMKIENLQTSVYAALGVNIPGLQNIQKSYTCDIKKVGEPAPGKDVAVLKIEGNDNLMTVSLGDDTDIQTGDTVFVIGYPAAATFNPALAAESAIESTMTSGLISAIKTMPGGWKVFQMDAAISGGNSGGPVFNNKGEVIGIATFGSVDFETGGSVQGMNFAIPVSIAKQFLNEVNVTPTESNLTALYKEGLELYGKQKFKKAYEKFSAVNDLNPGYPYIQEYISKTRTAINEGRDKSSDATLYIAIGGVILVIAVGVFIATRKKKKHTQVSVDENN
ncbi:MAG: S1C family serine protease [Tepidanaerobacteraceae bacterium]